MQIDINGPLATASRIDSTRLPRLPEARLRAQNALMHRTAQTHVSHEDHEVVIAGRRLCVRTLVPPGGPGIGQGPTLVLLHEALGCIAQWGHFPEELVCATCLPALLYDRYGHGRSEGLRGPRAADYLEAEALRVLPQVLQAFGITEPIPYGHSDGGTIALLFAAEYPAVPAALICEAHHVFLEDITVRGLRRAAEAYATGRLRDRLVRLHGDNLDPLFRGWNDIWLAPERRHWDIRPRLTSLQAPVLMIQGEHDEYGSEAQIQAVTSRTRGPAETLLIPDCRHVPHHECRERVLRQTADFLGRLRSPQEL